MAREAEQVDDVASEVARLWAERDLDAFVRPAARSAGVGTATDWGLSAAADAAVQPISLGGGIPEPATVPREELVEGLRRALDSGGLDYGGPLGYDPLRDVLAEHYGAAQGVDLTREHFMLSNGAAGAISLVCDAVLEPGDVVVTEAPTFSGTLRTFRGHGAEVLSVPTDGEGLHTGALAELLARLERDGLRAKLVYTISNFHNPTGVAMSRARRLELLRLAAEHGAFVLDDDAYGEIWFDERPPALAGLAGGEGVVTVGSFSKILAPGVRAGWIQAPPGLIERVARMRFDMGSSPLLHRVLAHVFADGRLERHLERVRPLYAERLDALTSALIEFAEPYVSFVRPRGGFFLWVRLLGGLTADGVQRAGLEEGVSFPIGYGFFPDRRDPDGEHIRLAYSRATPADLREAAARLGRACERAAE